MPRLSGLHWLGALGSMAVGLGHFFAASPHSRHRQLKALRSLDDRLLNDIGISREAAASAGRANPVRHDSLSGLPPARIYRQAVDC